MNEADTRANLIDPQRLAAGWGQVNGSIIRREEFVSLIVIRDTFMGFQKYIYEGP